MTVRAKEASCFCAKASNTANQRKTSAAIAQRKSPEAQFTEIRCSTAQTWARQNGRKPPKPYRIIMDKFPSVEVLSRYSHRLLPTRCQHPPGCNLKRNAPCDAPTCCS